VEKATSIGPKRGGISYTFTSDFFMLFWNSSWSMLTTLSEAFDTFTKRLEKRLITFMLLSIPDEADQRSNKAAEIAVHCDNALSFQSEKI
jgi:hypothetical protein